MTKARIQVWLGLTALALALLLGAGLATNTFAAAPKHSSLASVGSLNLAALAQAKRLPNGNVPVVTGRLTPPERTSAGIAAVEDLGGSEIIVDLGAHNVHPSDSPMPFTAGPDGGAIGTGNAYMDVSPAISHASTAGAFGTIASGFTPGEGFSYYVNGAVLTTGTVDARGRVLVGLNTGSGQGYLTYEVVGTTSGKHAGTVSQILNAEPLVPGYAAGPHAVNTSGGTGSFNAYGWGWVPNSPSAVSLYRNGVLLGSAPTSASGRFNVVITPTNNLDTAAIYTAISTTGVMGYSGTSIEERADAGTPPQGDNNVSRAFVDRAILPTAGGTVGIAGEGFQAGETVNLTGCATTSFTATANGAVSAFVTFASGNGIAVCTFTGASSGRVARAAIQKDTNVVNSPSGINAPSSVTTLATSVIVMYDRLPANQTGHIYLDGVDMGVGTTTNAQGFASSVLNISGITAGIHEVAFIADSGQIAIAPLWVTQSLVTATPTLTPLFSFTPTRTPTLTFTRTPFPTPTCLPQLVVFDRTKQVPGEAKGLAKNITGNNKLYKSAVKSNPGKAEYLAPDASFILAIDDGSSENSVGFGTATTESPSIYLNRFSPGAPLQLPYSIQSISVFWPTQSTNNDTFVGNTARLLVYLDADANNDPSNATLLGQQLVTVGVTNTFRTYEINPGIAVASAGDVYIGFEDYWAEPGNYTPKFYPAAVDESSGSQVRSWLIAKGAGTTPDINNLGNNDFMFIIDDLDLPGNWMIRATGNDARAGSCPPTFTPAVSLTPTRTRTSTSTRTPYPTPTCLPQLVVMDRTVQKAGEATTINKPANMTKSFSSLAVRKNPGTAEFLAPDASFIFALDDGSMETSIGFGGGGSESASIWLNRFSPGAPLVLPYSIQNISIFWPDDDTAGGPLMGLPVRLLVYLDTTTPGDPSDATKLGEQFVSVGITNAFQTYNLNPGIVVASAGDLYIGFEDFWAEGGYVPQLFPAALDTSSGSQARSWIVAMSTGGTPDVNVLSNNDTIGTIDSFGLPGNWMIRATGNDARAGSCPPTFTPLVSNTPTRTFTPTRTATPLPPTSTPTITPTPICAGSWTLRADYPVSVYDNGVTSLGGIIYSFGGVVTSTVASSYKYDPTSNTWTPIANLPAPRAKPGVVTDGTNIYIVGGSGTATIWKYNPVSNTYDTSLLAAPTAPWAATVAYLSGKIYKIGGCTTTACAASTNIVEAYDIAGNFWSTVASLPQATAWSSSVGLGGFIYEAGGIDAATDTPSAKTYRYDPVGNTWNDAAIADLPAPRWASASDVLGGKWVIAAGVVGTPPADSIDTNVQVWDSTAGAGGTWSPSIDPTLQAKYRIGGASVGSDFFIPGGDDGSQAGSVSNQRYRNLCAGSTIHGHLTWQGVAAANRPSVTGTLSICVSGAAQNFPFTTDTSGNFTVTTSIANGTYNWSVKGGRHLSNSSPLDGTALTISGGQATQEFGTQKGGNTNPDNIINATDFTNLKNQFGQAGVRSADADYNLVVNASDFTIQKNNFGQSGHTITCP